MPPASAAQLSVAEGGTEVETATLAPTAQTSVAEGDTEVETATLAPTAQTSVAEGGTEVETATLAPTAQTSVAEGGTEVETATLAPTAQTSVAEGHNSGGSARGSRSKKRPIVFSETEDDASQPELKMASSPTLAGIGTYRKSHSSK